jgi:L-rhamnose-H+ transport protein
MATGLLLVLAAAALQGLFLAPMGLTRQWPWELTWCMFSALGMLILNWAAALVFLPSPSLIFTAMPRHELLLLAMFGLTWGVGAILFGLGMDKLGLSLGYPIIMGLNAAVGTLIPLLSLSGSELLLGRHLFVLAGTAIGIVGIVISSIAGARREPQATPARKRRGSFSYGLVIAVAAGCLSALPNLGMAYATASLHAVRALGPKAFWLGNAVWLLFFTLGGLVNCVYCLLLMISRRSYPAITAGRWYRNLGWTAVMALMWIGSFYMYGAGALNLGPLGAAIGWPIFISLSIGVGVLCGWWRGEWAGASTAAKRLLWEGLLLIFIAVMVIPLGQFGI